MMWLVVFLSPFMSFPFLYHDTISPLLSRFDTLSLFWDG